MSTNIRRELIESSAREVERQQVFFFSSDGVLSLARFELCSLLFRSLAPRSSLSIKIKKNKYLSNRRDYKLQTKINGHAVPCQIKTLKEGFLFPEAKCNLLEVHLSCNPSSSLVGWLVGPVGCLVCRLVGLS